MRFSFTSLLLFGCAAIVTGTAKGEYKFSTLVLDAVRSDPFRMRRGTN